MFYIDVALWDSRETQMWKSQTQIFYSALSSYTCVFMGQNSVRRLSTSGANQEQMDEVMTPLLPFADHSNGATATQKHSMWICANVDLCVRGRWGAVLWLWGCSGKRGPHGTSDRHSSNICSTENSLTISLTDHSTHTYAATSLRAHTHAQESDDLLILQ